MSERISWTKITGIPKIVSDFFDKKGEVTRLIGGDWRDSDTRNAVKNRRLQFSNCPNLGSEIRKSYGSLKIPNAVESNLEKLDNPNTLTIVTGQQLGLFGGPAYTFYKALTAIFVAEKLTTEKHPVVPVFWMESADSDFSEINSIGFPPSGKTSRQCVYTPADFIHGKSAGKHVLTDEIEVIRDQVISWLKEGSFAEPYIELLQNSYQKGTLTIDAFRSLLTGILGEYGLIVFDPLAKESIKIGEEFWDRILENPDKLVKSYNIASGEIKSLRYPLQVEMREKVLPFFHIDDNGFRSKVINNSEGLYSLSKDPNTVEKFPKDLLKTYPGSFSPNVLTRSLYQDWILPTWIYIGGPSEIAYHMQIGRSYDVMNIPRPLIAPRLSITIVERSNRRLLDKQNWSVNEILGGIEILLSANGLDNTIDSIFTFGSKQFHNWIKQIRHSSENLGVNASIEIKKSHDKINYQWQKLQSRIQKKVLERDQTRITHAYQLQNFLLPDHRLQERHHSFLYYLSKYGKTLIQTIDSEKQIFNPQHIVIDLELEK